MVSCRFHFLRFASAAIALGGLGCLHASSAAAQGAGSIKGVVFFDKNGDGVRQNDEPGFSGVVVAIFGKRVDQRPFYMTTVTDSEGRFAFNGALIGDGSSFTVSTGGTPMAAAMPTHYRPRRTFYTAAKGGDDQGPGTLQRPFRTIGRAVPALAPGDLLYIRQGEYREFISPLESPIGGGKGWDLPIVVAGMPGETVVIRPPDSLGTDQLIGLSRQRQQYLVFDNLVLDGEGTAMPVGAKKDGKEPPPSHIRLINCEVKNSSGSVVSLAGDNHQIIHCRIHDSGQTRDDHGLLITGRTATSKDATSTRTPVPGSSSATNPALSPRLRSRPRTTT